MQLQAGAHLPEALPGELGGGRRDRCHSSVGRTWSLENACCGVAACEEEGVITAMTAGSVFGQDSPLEVAGWKSGPGSFHQPPTAFLPRAPGIPLHGALASQL